MNNRKEQKPIYQDPVYALRNSVQSNGLSDQNSEPLYYTNYQPINYSSNNSDNHECLLGENSCSPLCSGYTTNKCQIVAPIPGPQWQVQSAATVQKRLKNQQYTLSSAPYPLY